jgi:hypothetical protein
VAAGGDTQQPAHGGDRVVCLVVAHEPEPFGGIAFVSRANQAAAFGVHALAASIAPGCICAIAPEIKNNKTASLVRMCFNMVLSTMPLPSGHHAT